MEAQRSPAGIQPHGLRLQDKPLPIIAAFFRQVVRGLSGQNDIIVHVAKIAVMGQLRVKAAGIVVADLNMQPALLITFSDQIIQFLPFPILNWLQGICPYRVALLHCLYQIHFTAVLFKLFP